MKSFEIPHQFQSKNVDRIRAIRKSSDKLKRDFSPSILRFQDFDLLLSRHFGFCFGVQNAVEMAYNTIANNPDKRIFLLSEIIHNPKVNEDLKRRGLRFIQETDGTQLIPWEELNAEDIVLIPAFGTTNEIEAILEEKQLLLEAFDTTCPFVEKVWNRSRELAPQHSIIIHGTFAHEETRATFSKAAENGKALVVQNMKEAQMLVDFIKGGPDEREWNVFFKHQASAGFNFRTDLERIAVVNQTTMLAHETQAIADLLKASIGERYGEQELKSRFGSTRDTLCYATNDNQTATKHLMNSQPDITFVVGGENSSNTAHLVELAEGFSETYFIRDEKDLISGDEIRHYSPQQGKVLTSTNYRPAGRRIKIAITSGASCPDSTMEDVLMKLLSFSGEEDNIEAAISTLEEEINGI